MEDNQGLADTGRSKDFKIIFVCTGNTCRSCMAEGIFRATTAKDQPDRKFTVMSRGISAFDGDAATGHSVNALKTLWNIDISVHRARRLRDDDALQADLMLTMTRQHRDNLKVRYPERESCIFTLKEFAYPWLESSSGAVDIADPFGMPYEYYEGCAREIYECVKDVLGRLDGV